MLGNIDVYLHKYLRRLLRFAKKQLESAVNARVFPRDYHSAPSSLQCPLNMMHLKLLLFYAHFTRMIVTK